MNDLEVRLLVLFLFFNCKANGLLIKCNMFSLQSRSHILSCTNVDYYWMRLATRQFDCKFALINLEHYEWRHKLLNYEISHAVTLRPLEYPISYMRWQKRLSVIFLKSVKKNHASQMFNDRYEQYKCGERIIRIIIKTTILFIEKQVLFH